VAQSGVDEDRLVIVTDETEFYSTGAALQAAEGELDFHRLVLEQFPSAVLVGDSRGQTTFANAAARQWAKDSGRASLEGRPLAELFSPDATALPEAVSAALNQQGHWSGPISSPESSACQVLISRLEESGLVIDGFVALIQEPPLASRAPANEVAKLESPPISPVSTLFASHLPAWALPASFANGQASPPSS
jgi:PAS domain-containing protein